MDPFHCAETGSLSPQPGIQTCKHTHAHNHSHTHTVTQTYILPPSPEAQFLPYSYSSYRKPVTAEEIGGLTPETAAVDPGLPSSQSLYLGFSSQPDISLWPAHDRD